MIELAALQSPGIRHGFFTRQGGVSVGNFASLNCGYNADAAAHVTENRARAMRLLQAPAEALTTVRQVHGTRVIILDEGFDRQGAVQADALATRQKGAVLGILTADCAPVLLADPEAGIVGAAHAGWRGALAGVSEAAVAAMESLGASPARIRAGIGPCITQASYEVGPEFPGRFLGQSPAHGEFFRPAERPEHFQFDLPGFIASRLRAAGVGEIESSEIDTAADADRFFSYRRTCLAGEKAHGLGLSAIGLGF
jgi:hypothetical protein